MRCSRPLVGVGKTASLIFQDPKRYEPSEKRILIVGGVAGGATWAARARRLKFSAREVRGAAARWRERLGGPVLSDSADLVREDRER